jgi:hypothetical protein
MVGRGHAGPTLRNRATGNGFGSLLSDATTVKKAAAGADSGDG